MDHDSVYNDSDWLCSSADLIGFENDYTWYGDAAKESYPSLPFGLDSSMMPASSAMYIDEMSEVSPSMSQDLQSMPNSSNAARFHASVYLPTEFDSRADTFYDHTCPPYWQTSSDHLSIDGSTASESISQFDTLPTAPPARSGDRRHRYREGTPPDLMCSNTQYPSFDQSGLSTTSKTRWIYPKGGDEYSSGHVSTINNSQSLLSQQEEMESKCLRHISVQTPSKSKARTPTSICDVQMINEPNVFIFHCTFPGCYKRTFTRWYDFNRHYNGAHAIEKTIFWCPIPGCSRGKGENNHGFTRKDKMLSHVSNMHSSGE